MVPGHPSHSALGAFHPTPIASSRTSAQPTTLRRRRRRAGIRRRVRCRSRRRTKTTPERSTPPSERGTTTSTRTPTETSRDRGTPPPPPAPPSHPRRRRDAVTTRRKTTRSAPERSTPPAGVQGNYVNPHTDDDEPRPRDAHADPCPAATAPPFPPPRRPRRAAREAGFPVGSARPLRRRAAAKMSPRMWGGGRERGDEHGHACTRQDKGIQKHEGQADNIATIQASTVAQQVHATRAREAQARTMQAWETQARSVQTHAGAFGCMWGGERERGCRRR